MVILTSAHESVTGIVLDLYWPSTWPKYAYHRKSTSSQDSSRIVLQLPARSLSDESNHFQLLQTNKQVAAFDLSFDTSRRGISQGSPLYLPVHQSCLDLVMIFISCSTDTSARNSAGVPNGSLTSLKQLWEILYRRLASDPTQRRTKVVNDPNRYFTQWCGDDEVCWAEANFGK